MEEGKQQGGNSKSSSTFTNDLFGPKDSSSSSSIFGSVFGPASTGLRGDPSHNSAQAGWSRTHDSEYNKDIQGKRGNNSGGKNKERSPITSQNGEGGNNNDYFNSSIYYGGQQVYSPSNTTNQTNPTPHVFKGYDGKYDDSNGNNPSCEARGNWWQGSFYY